MNQKLVNLKKLLYSSILDDNLKWIQEYVSLLEKNSNKKDTHDAQKLQKFESELPNQIHLLLKKINEAGFSEEEFKQMEKIFVDEHCQYNHRIGRNLHIIYNVFKNFCKEETKRLKNSEVKNSSSFRLAELRGALKQIQLVKEAVQELSNLIKL